jgi:hypothetical protein
LLDISISSYGNKGNKRFSNRKLINRSFNDPSQMNLISNRYVCKVQSWIARLEYHKAQGKTISLAEDYYIW